MRHRLTWCATRFRIYQLYSLRKSSLKEQTANATCGPLQCILHWEIVRKVKRASFPCVAFFPCRLHMICMVKGQEDTRNVLVEPNRVSWLKRHFARIRYGPRSGTGRIPFCRRAAWYGRCVTPHVHAMAVKLPFGVWERSAKRACVLLSESEVGWTVWHSRTAKYHLSGI